MGLGLIGVVLPLLPTVPFLLLAAFCFARSSPKLHHWLITHPRFGPSIVAWENRGAISGYGKRAATVAILVTVLLSLALGAPGFVLAIQAVVLGGVMIFIWTRPSA